MPECVTPKHVSSQEDDIDYQHQGSDPDAEAVRKEEGPHRIICEKSPHNVGESQEVAVKILQDEGKTQFAKIALARLAHRACRGVRPERLVIGAAVVIASQAEQSGYPKNQQSRREGKETGVPAWFWPEHRMRRTAEKLG